ncbi:MAG: dTDP-4-dehydrorhamnose 3,5-epimerase [Comamonadaceae bacterium]|nr:dTDP-4-dehydrorhamnose 3,5-epimerase [Comamonadaceae bacterium]
MGKALTFETTPLDGVKVVVGHPRVDERGRFVRVFCADEFAALRPGLRFVQVNLSRTVGRGTVRGMHFQQAPAADAKLVRCVHGAVLDVAVDLRPHSPTFLAWHAVELSAAAETGVFIPEGCAHGFQALTDDAELLYLHTAAYAPLHEGGVRHDDPRLGIAWPLPAGEAISPRPIISAA